MGDINGIGPQIILDVISKESIFKYCNIVIFGSEQALNFYKKKFEYQKARWNVIKDKSNIQLNNKIANFIECSDGEVKVEMGNSNDTSGSLSLRFINDALFHQNQGTIDALVTAPVHKAYIKTNPPFTGHTGYLAKKANTENPLMIMTSESLRVALVTQHLPIQEISKNISKDSILESIISFNESLKKDFGIYKPKIAVLGLNPHSGDEGKIGDEEKNIIAPAIKTAFEKKNIITQGPFAADGFFSSNKFTHFDGVLAMYHDQGLIPFKYIAGMSGVNYTANLPYVRTSPDHGVASDIVESGNADSSSMLHSIFEAIDIYKTRKQVASDTANPLKRYSIKK